MKTLARFCILITGAIAIASTGCSVTGYGTLPSAAEDSHRRDKLKFTVDLAYDQDLQTITGNASFVDCAASINATSSFSAEDVTACLETINNVEGIEDFLGESLAVCLGVEDTGLQPEQVGLILGRYELTDECKRECKRKGYGRGHYSHGRGHGKGHDKGRGRGHDRDDDENDIIGTGCLIAVYVDCEVEGCVGDGLAVALVDDSDPTSIFYTNCGILDSGEITVVYTP